MPILYTAQPRSPYPAHSRQSSASGACAVHLRSGGPLGGTVRSCSSSKCPPVDLTQRTCGCCVMAGNPPSRHLWVGGLPEEIGEAEIKELFTK